MAKKKKDNPIQVSVNYDAPKVSHSIYGATPAEARAFLDTFVPATAKPEALFINITGSGVRQLLETL